MGNVLLGAAFASYIGPFDMASRRRIVCDVWLPDLQHRAIPMSNPIQPLVVLTTAAIKVFTYATSPRRACISNVTFMTH